LEPLGLTIAQEAPKKQSESKPQSSVKTQHTFDDFLIQGKFHFSDQTVVTVEEDKVLDGLVGVRKDFKDRIKDLE
jgi:hypothetical protein